MLNLPGIKYSHKSDDNQKKDVKKDEKVEGKDEAQEVSSTEEKGADKVVQSKEIAGEERIETKSTDIAKGEIITESSLQARENAHLSEKTKAFNTKLERDGVGARILMNLDPNIMTYDKTAKAIIPIAHDFSDIVDEGFVRFLGDLERQFGKQIDDVLEARRADQDEINARVREGKIPVEFAGGIQSLAELTPQETSIPREKLSEFLGEDQFGIEITGPTDKWSMINYAFDPEVTGAATYMMDNEDSHLPSHTKHFQADQNTKNRIHDLELQAGDSRLRPGKREAFPMKRSRGLHMRDTNFVFKDENGDYKSAHAALVDIAMYAYHNAKFLQEKGLNTVFYFPKLQTVKGAELMQAIVNHVEKKLELPQYTIQANALIEDPRAMIRANEIMKAAPSIVAFNNGRWDYMAAMLELLEKKTDLVPPHRDQLKMSTKFMAKYDRGLSQVCFNNGRIPIGGMSANVVSLSADPKTETGDFYTLKRMNEESATWEDYKAKVQEWIDTLPKKENPERTDLRVQLQEILTMQQGKVDEIKNGKVRAWAASPQTAKCLGWVFARAKNGELKADKDAILATETTAADIFDVPNINDPNYLNEKGEQYTITRAEVKDLVLAVVEYMEPWIAGQSGCVAPRGKMEDVATARIGVAMLRIWARRDKAITKDGERIDFEYIKNVLKEVQSEYQQSALADTPKNAKKYPPSTETTVALACQKLMEAVTMKDYTNKFLTDFMYPYVQSDAAKERFPVPVAA